ncbi:SPASM domain-containing protein [Pelotalea chapellei]|uniref:Radical SAM protein n=1 Tax=Pelotalea chapellei TaxID=44671 RepID=A0ABS5UAL1_9BACT|nr:SPASM domain-containing protein [Pelotalea chapellei]MBT1072723.1 radical SAM protein [Pelotalea chapellei]
MTLDAEIELTSFCQLNCPFCRTGGALRDKYQHVSRGMMSRESFQNIVTKIHGLRNVLLYNWGEPFLHPDLLWFVQQTKRAAVTCQLSTNMHIMDEALADGLVKAQLNRLLVSCDGMTQQSYEQYRRGGNLKKVLDNTRILAEAKKQLGSSFPEITFQFVVNRFNEHEVPSFERFAKEHGADSVLFVNLCACTPEGYEQFPSFEPEDSRWARCWVIGSVTACRQPWNHVSFDWNGDVYPCCNPSGISDYRMGNINESSFDIIWNGPKYQYARRFCTTGIAEDNGFTIMCHACYNRFPNRRMRENDMYGPCLPPPEEGAPDCTIEKLADAPVQLQPRTGESMFWDDILLVTEQIEKYGLRKPFADLGGMERPCIADYGLTIATGDQNARYVSLTQRPFDHIDREYMILNPDKGDPFIEDLPYAYANAFGTAVCLNVLEHVQNPFRVFAALYQVMQQNSLLIVETVFSFPYHPSPNDYWRFTPDCLRYLGENAGFKVLECGWRMTISADKGILNIANSEPQDIRSVYATFTKGDLSPLPGGTFPLPARHSSNPAALNIINGRQP